MVNAGIKCKHVWHGIHMRNCVLWWISFRFTSTLIQLPYKSFCHDDRQSKTYMRFPVCILCIPFPLRQRNKRSLSRRNPSVCGITYTFFKSKHYKQHHKAKVDRLHPFRAKVVFMVSSGLRMSLGVLSLGPLSIPSKGDGNIWEVHIAICNMDAFIS